MNTRAIVLADGMFPAHPLPLSLLTEKENIICCDGAVDKLIAYQLVPYAIVGDMDSASIKAKQKFQHLVIQSDEQNTNDLTKAVMFCIDKKFSQILILGATGLREDHTIGNISLLSEYGQIIDVQIITDYGIFEPIYKTTSFKSYPGQQVSVFSILPTNQIESENLKYPLKNIDLNCWYKGSLNESTFDNFKLIIKDSGCLIVFRQHCNI